MDMPSTIKAVQRRVGVTASGTADVETWAAIASALGIDPEATHTEYRSKWAKEALSSYRERNK